MTTTKLDQHEEALAEHINAVRDLREALADVDRLAKINDAQCDTIHGLEAKLARVLELLNSQSTIAALAKEIHRNDLNAGRSGYCGEREADRDNAECVLAWLRVAIAEGRDDE